MKLNQKQKEYITDLYHQGVRNPWWITSTDYAELKLLKDFETLEYEVQLFLLELDEQFNPPKAPARHYPGL